MLNWSEEKIKTFTLVFNIFFYLFLFMFCSTFTKHVFQVLQCKISPVEKAGVKHNSQTPPEKGRTFLGRGHGRHRRRTAPFFPGIRGSN